MKRTQLHFLLPLAILLCLLSLWEAFVFFTNTPLYVLPAPSAVLLAFFREFPVLLGHGTTTLLETALGLSLAIALGFFLACLMDAYPLLRTAIYPLLVVTQTIPVIVLAPIFIIYLGFGIAPKVLTVVLMCFFPIAISFSDGMGQQDLRQVNLLRSMGASKLKRYTLLKIPGALPAFFSGLKVAATYSVSGAVVGEWLSSSSGLGYYMLRVKNGYMLDKLFASVLMVVLLSLGIHALVRLLSYLTIRPPIQNKKES